MGFADGFRVRGLDSNCVKSNAKDLTDRFDSALSADPGTSSHNQSLIRQSAPRLGLRPLLPVQWQRLLNIEAQELALNR